MKLFLIKHRKAEESLEFELRGSRQLFLKPSISIEVSWIKGLTILDVYNSILNITERNNKFELYADKFDEFSIEELKDELEEILGISDITPSHLQKEKIKLRKIPAYKKLGSEKSSTVGYIVLLMGYLRLPFRVFESYLKIVVELDEDNIQVILKQCYSIFNSYELSLVFIQSKMFQRLFTQSVIKKEPYNMNMMMLT